MKTLVVNFSKRDEKNRFYLTPEQCLGLKTKEEVRLTDEDIAVRGVVTRKLGRMYILINWDSTEFHLRESK